MLFIVRQEGKQVLGDALVELMVGHLNADIVGSIDTSSARPQAISRPSWPRPPRSASG
jgi:hypothetical protein